MTHWVEIELKMQSEDIVPAEVRKLFPGLEVKVESDHCRMTVTDTEERRLDDCIKDVMSLVESQRAGFEKLRDVGRATIVVGWTPHAPQDGIFLAREALATLSSLGIEVLLDTYTQV